MTKLPFVAWTGGNLIKLSPSQRSMVAGLREMISIEFRRQVIEYVEFWRTPCDLDTCRIFWHRAVADVHATYREACYG